MLRHLYDTIYNIFRHFLFRFQVIMIKPFLTIDHRDFIGIHTETGPLIA